MISVQDVLTIVSGGVVGFSRGLIGGGGSVLAVPLRLYVVGIRDPHVAIGTSALAVAANAFANLLSKGANVRIDAKMVPVLVTTGLGAGLLFGFFGIGGGFLIVPGLIFASGMTILNAVGSSLFSVGAFGVTTAGNYAVSGLVDWRIAGLFIVGGAVGGLAGMRLAIQLSGHRGVLTAVFASVLFAVAAYMLYRSAGASYRSGLNTHCEKSHYIAQESRNLAP